MRAASVAFAALGTLIVAFAVVVVVVVVAAFVAAVVVAAVVVAAAVDRGRGEEEEVPSGFQIASR